jgi:fibronectin-binding autotransporter adhesin
MNISDVSLRLRFSFVLIFLLSVSAPLVVQAQLVEDGQTAILDGVTTNVVGGVTIGTNGSFTLLVATNNSAVTSGTVNIGMNSSAANNRLVVSAYSMWDNSGDFNVGYSGSFNELDVVGGSKVTDIYGYIGYNFPSSSNTVLVSDPGSVWQSTYVYLGQSGGANNQLIVTNGGRIGSSFAVLGTGFGTGNSAIVTGANSSWANSYGLSVGAYGSNSLLIVTNGGTVYSGTNSGLGMLGASSVSNLAVVTDAESAWIINGSLTVGQHGSGNELDILNGGKVTDTAVTIGGFPGGSNNLVLVSGAGSVWTNTFTLYVGEFNSSSNTLIITNGGQVYSGSSIVQGPNDSVVISGIGSAWNSGDFLLGNQAFGGERLAINHGGTLIVSNTYNHDYFCNSNLLTLADVGSLLRCKILSVGSFATGNECVVSNGATLAAWGTNATVVGGYATRLTITGAGTLWTNAGDLQFGQNSNVLSILDGATVVNTNGYVQNNSASATNKPNTVIIAGTGSLWKNLGSFHVTDSGAQLLITNGGKLSTVQSYFGDDPHSGLDTNCFALVSGPGSLWASGTLYIGNNGVSNRVLVTDSGALNSGMLWIGYHGPHNQMTVSNSGTVTVAMVAMGSANSYTNSLTLDGGTLLVTNSSISMTKYGTLTMNSGLLTTPFLTTDFTANKIILNGGTFQSGGTTYSNTNSFAIGNGSDAATYEMLFEPPGNLGTHNFSGGVVVSNNGLLKGFAAIIGSVSVSSGGKIAPGTPASIATITQRGNLTLNAGGTIVMKLNAFSGTSDSWIGATNIVYGGTLQLTNLAGSLAAGNSFKLFGATNYSGAFANLMPATPGVGLRWDTNELTVDGVLRVLSSTTPSPAVGSITMANGNIMITATGGVPYDPCYLLSCTNLPAASTDWSPVATNYFDSSGGTTFTNAVPPAEPQRYFRLQVN